MIPRKGVKQKHILQNIGGTDVTDKGKVHGLCFISTPNKISINRDRKFTGIWQLVIVCKTVQQNSSFSNHLDSNILWPETEMF
jgi:hypothetical protein